MAELDQPHLRIARIRLLHRLGHAGRVLVQGQQILRPHTASIPLEEAVHPCLKAEGAHRIVPPLRLRAGCADREGRDQQHCHKLPHTNPSFCV